METEKKKLIDVVTLCIASLCVAYIGWMQYSLKQEQKLFRIHIDEQKIELNNRKVWMDAADERINANSRVIVSIDKKLNDVAPKDVLAEVKKLSEKIEQVIEK